MHECIQGLKARTGLEVTTPYASKRPVAHDTPRPLVVRFLISEILIGAIMDVLKWQES